MRLVQPHRSLSLIHTVKAKSAGALPSNPGNLAYHVLKHGRNAVKSSIRTPARAFTKCAFATSTVVPVRKLIVTARARNKVFHLFHRNSSSPCVTLVSDIYRDHYVTCPYPAEPFSGNPETGIAGLRDGG